MRRTILCDKNRDGVHYFSCCVCFRNVEPDAVTEIWNYIISTVSEPRETLYLKIRRPSCFTNKDLHASLKTWEADMATKLLDAGVQTNGNTSVVIPHAVLNYDTPLERIIPLEEFKRWTEGGGHTTYLNAGFYDCDHFNCYIALARYVA
ncbi:MAG: hypothetical protein ACK4SY_06750 [Pyrobaculum sp.]